MLNELAGILKGDDRGYVNTLAGREPVEKMSEKEIDDLLDDAWENSLLETARSIKDTDKALLISNRMGYVRGMATALRNKAYHAMVSSENKRAIEEVRMSLNLAPENDYKLLGTLWDILAMSYYGLGVYDEAVESTYKSIGFFEKTDYIRGLAWSRHNLALVYKNINETDKAEREFFKALDIFRKIDHKSGVSRVCTFLSSIYRNSGRYDESMKMLDEAERSLYSDELSIQSFSLFLGKATTLRLMGRLEEAGSLFEKSYEIIKQVENFELESQYEYEVALYCRDLKKPEAACDHLDKAIELANRLDSKIMKRDIHHARAGIFEDMGNPGGALRYYKSYIATTKEILDRASIQKIHNLEIQKEIELAEQEKNYHRKLQEETEKLLKNVLPELIVEELKSQGHVKPKRIESATAIFTDFVGFTAMSSHTSPEEIVSELDYCFSGFDKIMEELGIEKLKTIGDGYMAVAGSLDESDDHMARSVRAGLRIRSFIEDYKKTRQAKGKEFWDVRIGIHTGSLIAGVIGNKKFAYDVWGDTVNTASRIESAGRNGEVNISSQVYDAIKDQFLCEYAGEIEAKGKGVLKLYTVKDEI